MKKTKKSMAKQYLAKIGVRSRNHAIVSALVFVILFGGIGITLLLVSRATTCTVSSNLVNSCRPWIGAAVSGDPNAPAADRISQFNYLEKLVGHPLDIFHDYHPAGDLPLNSDELHFATRSNTYDYINWKPSDNWASAGGSNAAVNAQIKQAADNFLALQKSNPGIKVFLTVFHEPENNVSAFDNAAQQQACKSSSSFTGLKGNSGTPDQYRAMWQNVENIFHQEGVTNVVWVMDYMGYKNWDCLIPYMWPGNNLVDWVAFDSYAGGDQTWGGTVGRIYDVLQADNGMNVNGENIDFVSKPWGSAEFGDCRSSSDQQLQGYFSSIKTALDNNTYPRIKMYMVYDDTGNGAGPGCLVDHLPNGSYDATKLAAFNQFADDNIFTGSNPGPSDPVVSLAAPAAGSTLKGKVKVSVNATDNAPIASVQVLVDGKAVATLKTNPYTYSLDTTTLSNGGHSLQATAVNTSGGVGASSMINITVANKTPPPPSKGIGWMVTTSAITNMEKVGASKSLINTAFNTKNSYTFGSGTLIGVPTVDYKSEAAIAAAFKSGALPGKYKALIYDNEKWPFTPSNEQKNPAYYEQLVGQMAKAHSMEYIATPGRDLVYATGTLVGNSEDATYLARNIPGDAAKYAYAIDIQAQGIETNTSNFSTFSAAAAKLALAANPNVKIYIGLSTGPGGQKVTDQQMLAAYNSVKTFSDGTHLADGYWLNVSGKGKYCPQCGNPNPQLGVYLLQQVYGGSSPTQFTAPKDGATVSGNVPVSATTTTTGANLALKEDSSTLKTCSNATKCSTSWNTSKLSNGDYTLAAVVSTKGSSKTTSINVTLNNGTANCTLNAILVNPCRPLFGAAAHGNPSAPGGPKSNPTVQFDYLESISNHKFDVYRDYITAPASDTSPGSKDGVPLTSSELSFIKSGVTVDINWDVANKYADGESLADGGTKYINDQIAKAAQNFLTLQKQDPNVKVFFSPWHEMNDHSTANVSGCKVNNSKSRGTPAQFIAAWQNIYKTFQAAGVHNVVWTLNYASYGPNQCLMPLNWPGSQYVDWVIYDTYDHDWNKSISTWGDTLGQVYNYLQSLPASKNATVAAAGRGIATKSWGIGEFGTCKNNNASNATQYYKDGATAVTNNTYPKLKMYLVFADTGNNSGDACLTNYDINGKQDNQKQQAFNQLVDAVMSHSGGHQTPPSTPANLASPTQTSNSIKLTWSASKSSSYPSSKLTYTIYRGDTKVGHVTGSTSYTDTGLSPNTSYSYTVTATDPAGNVSTTSKSLSETTDSSQGLSISISGNKLVNGQGQVVHLTGVDRIGGCLKGTSFDGPTNEASVVAMTKYHINAVRLTENEDCWLGINTKLMPKGALYGQALRTAVTQYVNLLTKHGIYVVIDMHVNAPGNKYLSQAQQVMADEDHAPAYWKLMADTFKSNPAVIFELYNEPHIDSSNTNTKTASDAWNCWLNGCTANQYLTVRKGRVIKMSWATAGMQQLVNVVRGEHANNIVSLGGLYWSNDLTQWLAHKPTDPANQLAASFHNYMGWRCEGPGDVHDTTCWDTIIAGVAKSNPVLTTEFGQDNCGSNYVNQYMNWADQHDVSYTAWVWVVGTCQPGISHGDAGKWGLLANWSGAANPYGKPILGHIAGQVTPTVSITSPAQGSKVNGTITVSAKASDGSNVITKLDLKVGSTDLKACTSSPCSVSWDTKSVQNGSHTITATATAGNGSGSTTTGSASVNVKVANGGSNCQPNSILENPCHPVIGAAAKGNPGTPSNPLPKSKWEDRIYQFSYLDGLLGQKLDVVRDYHSVPGSGHGIDTLPLDPNSGLGKIELQFVKQGTTLDLNWAPSSSWKEAESVADGGSQTTNNNIVQAAKDISKVAPHKVFLTLWWEMNEHVSAADASNKGCSKELNTKDGHGSPDQFNAAWQNIYNTFNQTFQQEHVSSNVVWVLDYGGYSGKSCWIPYMYPGNKYVDWVVWDTYSGAGDKTWAQTGQQVYNQLSKDSTPTRDYKSKPWGLGEFGTCNATDDTKIGNYLTTGNQSLMYAIQHGLVPNLHMYLVYADTGNTPGLGCLTDYDGEVKSQTIYDHQKQLDFNQLYSAIVGNSAPFPDVSIASPKPNSSVKGIVPIDVAATETGSTIKSVQVLINGKTATTLNKSPYDYKWDTTKIPDGSYTIEAKATDKSGHVGTSGQESVKVDNTGGSSKGITVSGNQFYLNGQPFTPHGFNSIALLYSKWCAQPQTASAHNSLGTAELDKAKNVWYANTLRFQVSQPILASSNGATYAKQIEADVNTVRQAGFIVDISMQDQHFACGPAMALPGNETENAWKTLINNTNLKQDPDIIFELFNETQNQPVTTPSTKPTIWNWPDWQNGGRQISDSKSPARWGPYTPIGMQDLVNYLRGPLGVNNVLLADGAQYASTLENVPLLKDPAGNNQIAYVIHPYSYAKPSNYDARWGKLSGSHPVIATEWNCYYNKSSNWQAETATFLNYMRTTVHVGILGHAMDTGSFVVNDPLNACGKLFQKDYTDYFAPGSHTPQVTITTPKSGDKVSGVVPVDITATVGTGKISKVQLLIDNKVVDTMTSTPYDYKWDTSSLKSGTYTLLAKAYASASNVGTSPSVSVTVASNAPQPPNGLNSTGQTDTTIGLAWKDSANNPSNIDHFLVYRNGAVVGKPTALTYTDTGLTPQTTYKYSVAAVSTTGQVSGMSNSIQATTSKAHNPQPPTTPKNLAAKAASANQVNLTWDASTASSGGVTGYKLLRDGKSLGTTTKTSFGDGTAKPNTTYSYQVAAYNSAGTSPYSPKVTVTTPPNKPPVQTHGATMLYVPSTDSWSAQYMTIVPSVTSDFDGSPLPGVPPIKEGYRIFFRGRVVAPTTGSYTFYVDTTDLSNISLQIDNKTVVADSNSSAAERSVTLNLSAGSHNFHLQYTHEHTAPWGEVSLLWDGPGISKELVPTASLYPSRYGLRGRYYNNTSISSPAVLYRFAVGGVNYSEASDTSPDPGIVNKTKYSVDWDGFVIIPKDDTYTFYTQTDGGAKLWVNNKQLINDWSNHSSVKQNSGKITLKAGIYPISMEYYHDQGAAAARLLWSSSSTKQQLIPPSSLLENVPNQKITSVGLVQ
ncbi:MAG TPA: Ig-like domain-containing protein [Candidatus Saccharimonadales bacterium]|nr:Ig-like domain-containing protein [Candidatus Saccharimonadales bacterium]